MAKLWRLHAHDPQRLERLQRESRLSSVVAQLLLCRGIDDPNVASEFLEAKLSQLRDPALLGGVPQAVERIMLAIRERRKITVYGDYDVDGMAATSILYQCLGLLGANVGYYVPHRLDEGYGLHDDALRTLKQQGTELVVTVDCGAASLAEAATAREIGLELIITDHHEFRDTLPDAAAIVHPRLPSASYPFGGLSGAGVALKLAWALCQAADNAKRVSERLKNFLIDAVGLAALGTVADVVPLVDENRVLVLFGLQSLKQHPGLGLTALFQLTQLDKKARLDADDIGFMIAPRLNAAGRLGQAQLGVELLTTTSSERATALAEYIHELNNSRQSLERSVYLAANKQASEQFDVERDAAFVLADHGWHPGVIGIVAGRLAEKFHRPVILIALDEVGVRPGIGSCRSIPGLALHEALVACSEHLLSHGGHAAAAGLKIEPAKVEAFREAFVEHVSGELNAAPRQAELWIDAEVPLAALTLSTIEQIERLAPFGQANHRPVFCASGVTLVEPPKVIGGGGRHLSLKLQQGNLSMRGVAFGGAEWLDELLKTEGPIDVVFRPIKNEYRGRCTVELQLTDWRASRELAAVE